MNLKNVLLAKYLTPVAAALIVRVLHFKRKNPKNWLSVNKSLQ